MQVSVEESYRHMSPSSRLRARRVTGSAPFGAVEVQPVREPTSLAIGQTKTFEYDIMSVSTSHLTDPDHCFVGLGGDNGYLISVSAEAGGDLVAVDRNVCLPANALGHGPHTFVFELRGTNEGSVEVRIVVRGEGSDQILDDRTVTVTIGSGNGGGGGGVDPTDPPPDQNGDGGLLDGPLLPCFIDPNRSCATPEVVAWSALAGVGTIALITLKS